MPVIAVCADYTRPFPLPPLPGAGGKRVGFFPGSTIGNFEPDAAVAFLANYARILGPGGEMLIGVDLKKDPEILEAAYNDRAGVTAAFNLNLLERINRELDGDLDIDRFEHVAFYNEAEGRVEIYIRSLADQAARIAGKTLPFRQGRTDPHRILIQILGRRIPRLGGARRLSPGRHLDRPRRTVQRPLFPAAVDYRENKLRFPRCRATAAKSLGSDATRRLSSSNIATVSRICSSLCAAVRKKRSRAARSGTAG